jgi:hypothetical protein
MFIKVNRVRGFRRAIRYNEKKVENGKALCIHAGNFIIDAEQLTLADKYSRFYQLDRLRPDYPKRFIHASISVHPNDEIGREKFVRIATDYLKQIGFAGQPWLLYQHNDTKVPHVHLIASRVTSEGEILPTYMEFNRLVGTLRQLEIDYGLTPSHRRERDADRTLSTALPVRPTYGKVPTRDAITSALAYVLPNYNYSNWVELNALLRQYGIWADNGKPGGTLAATRGLSYQMLDGGGRQVGTRVRATAIGFNPGLDYLEGRFRDNSQRGTPDLTGLSARVRLASFRASDDWSRFERELRTGALDAVPFMNTQGKVYDIVFIDHARKLAVSAQRLIDSATLKHFHLRAPEGRTHQYALVRDMNRARLTLTQQPSLDEESRTLQLKKERQHKISR